MEMRVGLLFLLVLGAGQLCSSARHLTDAKLSHISTTISDIPAARMRDHADKKEKQASDVTKKNQVCTLCEEFAGQAFGYLSENKTQTEIIDILHNACSQVRSFKEQCITLVDYYAPLFFLEVSTVQPADFCKRVNLCREMVFISSKLQQDKCGLCHRAVSEVLIKLKNPDTQLEILEVLLKACNSMDKTAAKCKRLVFEYGPLILTNAEQFLETKDICTMLHACDSRKPNREEAATMLKADS